MTEAPGSWACADAPLTCPPALSPWPPSLPSWQLQAHSPVPHTMAGALCSSHAPQATVQPPSPQGAWLTTAVPTDPLPCEEGGTPDRAFLSEPCSRLPQESCLELLFTARGCYGFLWCCLCVWPHVVASDLKMLVRTWFIWVLAKQG